jgi:hypothetical protein
MSEVRFPNYKITSKSFEGGIEIKSDGSFNTDIGSSYDFAIDNIIYTTIDSSSLKTDNISELTNSAGITFSTVTKIDGGLQDSNVTSTIFLGDSSNTSLLTSFNNDSIVGAINENKNAFIEMLNPSGFINTTDQISSFVNATRTFQIAPVSSNYSAYIGGVRFTISTAKNIIITDIEGIHVIYFDYNIVLQEIVNPTASQWKNIYINYCIVSTIYWDATNSKQIYFSGNNEYHGINMSGTTHYYLHSTQGARYNSGCLPETFSVDQDGSLDSHAQFGITSGVIIDEDLTVSLSSIASTTGFRVYYLLGTVMRRASATTFPIITTGTGRAAYNLNTGGTWSLAEVTNADFVLVHLYAINDSTYPYIIILGQNKYGTLSAARTGSTEEINSITIGENFPLAEMLPIATVIFQTNNIYTNTVKSRIRSTGAGGNFVDWRRSQVSTVSTPISHDNLTGLTNDDHLQYALLTGRSGDSLKIDQIDEFTSSAGVTIEGVRNENNGIIFPNTSKTDKIVFMDSLNYEIGIATNNMRFRVPQDGTEEFQYQFAGTIRLDIRLRDTNVCEIINPNGTIKIESVEFNNLDITTINSITFQDEINTSKLIFRPNYTLGIRTGGNLEFDIPTGEEYEFRINNSDIFKVGATGILTNIINELGSGSGVTIEGILLKDNAITANGNSINIFTGATTYNLGLNGITCDSSNNMLITLDRPSSANEAIIVHNDVGVQKWFAGLRGGNQNYTIESEGTFNAVALLIRDSDGGILLPAVYGDTISGSTIDLSCDSTGRLGLDTSILASKINIDNSYKTDFIYNLNPVKFNYRKKDTITNNYTDEYYNQQEYGLIAEEVDKIAPDFTFKIKVKNHVKNCKDFKKHRLDKKCTCKCPMKNELKSVKYKALITPILKCVQQQKKQISALQNRCLILEKKISNFSKLL